jgi:hypothetical protein
MYTDQWLQKFYLNDDRNVKGFRSAVRRAADAVYANSLRTGASMNSNIPQVQRSPYNLP